MAEVRLSRILVIDDEKTIREVLREILEQNGYEVALVPDGRAGLRLHQQESFDLVITDLIMPEQEGLETILALRRSTPDVKIIAISGGGRAGMTDMLRIASMFGAQRTLLKPFSYDEILNAVHELMDEQTSTPD